MFANAANMKNLFFENPNDADIKEIGDIFYIRDAIIPIDTSDIKDVLEGADNAIVLHGKATGYNRCADAIEDAVLHICTIAKDYDLFSATNVIIFISSPKEAPMLMSEIEAINTFVQMFSPITQWRWGLEESKEITDMKVTVIASNLKKKFRIWRANIPRDKANGSDRMRNPWLYIKLSMEEENVNKTVLHDMIVHYFE